MNQPPTSSVSLEIVAVQGSESLTEITTSSSTILSVNEKTSSCFTITSDSCSIHCESVSSTALKQVEMEYNSKNTLDVEISIQSTSSTVMNSSSQDTTEGMTVYLAENSPSVQTSDGDKIQEGQNEKDINLSSGARHGISRYAPYGTRFAALMMDGTYKTSHIAGDLADRARQKNGKGGRVDLVLITHEGEKSQLDIALSYYDSFSPSTKPGPSEVLTHLKDKDMDWDYRKGPTAKLLQRNASNFFKRMMEHAKKSKSQSHELAHIPNATPIETPKKETEFVDNEITEAATILRSLKFAKFETVMDQDYYMDIDDTPSKKSRKNRDRKQWDILESSKTSFYEILQSKGGNESSCAAETFDWEEVKVSRKEKRSYESQDAYEYDTEDSDYIASPSKKRVKSGVQNNATPVKEAATPFTSTGSVLSSAPSIIRKGSDGLNNCQFLKGLSRHSPYGTRFCARMPNGEMRESYLAGDLADRVKSGKGQSELLLVHHEGEILQLQAAWEYIKKEGHHVGAGSVLDRLRELGMDQNHRKPGSSLLQKNAGNFFKRVQEYGRRKQVDPTYLEITTEAVN